MPRVLTLSVAAVAAVAAALLHASLRSELVAGGASAEPAQAGAEAPPPAELEELFAAAERSADGLYALIAQASSRVASAGGDEGDRLALRLEPYCRRAFFGPERFEGMQALGLTVHSVGKGELPGAIAKHYGFSDGLFARLNQDYEPRNLRVGQQLKVLDLRGADLRLTVDRLRHRLAAWRQAPSGQGRLLLMYVTVGLGAPATPTPSGTTRVVERALDCEWTDPVTGVTYPPGDPGNLLGGYWMRLDEAGIGKKGIGLHGFTGDDPSAWLGKDASNGCVRMLQDDIDRVFHLARVGTPVELVP